MVRLNKTQLQDKVKWIRDYGHPTRNAADSSTMDANANVESKNIATMASEVHKDINIQVNRAILHGEISKLFDEQTADQYIEQLEEHQIYTHDETSLMPYCVAIDSTPFLYTGLTQLGGDSKAPQHLGSYCGGYINLAFAIASQFAGAVADVSLLKDFHYFAKKDYGTNYLETAEDKIKDHLSQIIYSINMPAATRGYQSIFYNTSVFDEFYFKGLYETAYYPDGTRVIEEWDGINALQKYFLSWFNKERSRAILTFPVITAALKLNDDGSIASDDWRDYIAKEFSEGHSFFVYMDKNVTSLSSCCRLRNDISDQLSGDGENGFSYSLGAGGISTGSKNVITLNVNRMVQDGRDLVDEIHRIYKYQVAFESWFRQLKDQGLLPVYDAGFIALEKQYLTIGLNGVVEAAEYLGMTPSYNDEYVAWLQNLLGTISAENRKMAKHYSDMFGWKIMFNTEFVPAENLGVKNYNWDRKAGYVVPSNRNTYNSYFYAVESETTTVIDKLRLHGHDTIQYLDGGSALHLNLGEHLTKEGFTKLLDATAHAGANYWTYNVRTTICNECGNIDKRDLTTCPKCGATNVDHATRIIGYLRRESSFSKFRREEASHRTYHPTQYDGNVIEDEAAADVTLEVAESEKIAI